MGTVFFDLVYFGPCGAEPASFAHAMRAVLGLEVGLLVATFAAALLLPRWAWEESSGR
ncbi:MAG TPA: hypothetical protein VFC19_34455 [Candidatus Limnocylindrales bacterium]|nr:hypothetical protein [Candidatus Limnocylindrales bacterium]